MVQRVWYFFVHWYVYAGLQFYFKKLIVTGKQNIPEGPVIFAANHQNAFLDALVIATTNRRYSHFLVRADVFKKPFARWLLGTLNMKPIYRIRDGWQALAQNQQTFDYCKEVFLKGEAIIMFPEGSHGEKRRVRPLSKGFTRVAFETLEKYPGLTINIVPVGLNYTAHQKFRSSVSIYYGTPIRANDYFNEPLQAESARLRIDLMESMKKLTLHVESLDQYSETITTLEHAGVNYLDPAGANYLVEHLDGSVPAQKTIKTNRIIKTLLLPFYYTALLVNILPLTFWYRTEKKIKDPVFIASIKFCLGVFVFPIVYLLEVWLAYMLAGPIVAMCMGLFCVLSTLLIEFVQRKD